MSRKFTVKAATGPYGNNINVQYGRMMQLRRSLQDAYDILENMDDETFHVCDGEALMDDLDTAIHEIVAAMDWVKGL